MVIDRIKTVDMKYIFCEISNYPFSSKLFCKGNNDYLTNEEIQFYQF